jgi:hypothetical protein
MKGKSAEKSAEFRAKFAKKRSSFAPRLPILGVSQKCSLTCPRQGGLPF